MLRQSQADRAAGNDHEIVVPIEIEAAVEEFIEGSLKPVIAAVDSQDVGAAAFEHRGELVTVHDQIANSVQLLDLLLHLAAKFQWIRDFVKWLGSPARPDDYNRSITQHPAEGGLAHFNALHFVEQHFDRLPAGQARLDYHTAVRHRHFRRVPPHHAH